MKINQSYWKDNADDKKDRRAEWIADARRHAVQNESDAAVKHKQIQSPVKDDSKFSGLLESAAKPQKAKQTSENTGEQRRDDEKKDKKNAAREKDSTDNRTGNDRIERNQTSYGEQFGGSGGFGGDISQTVHLSENFAARSILHIADLERMILAVRKLTKLDGRREITLKLSRSVLEGLQVKITTGDAARTQIEFLAANEKIRSQIEDHSDELAEILRGRGVNLQSLRTAIDSSSEGKPSVFENKTETVSYLTEIERQEAANENTFENESPDGKKTYRP